MSMTQRYAGMLRRQAGDWDKQGMPVQAECAHQAARHMEELQAAKDAWAQPWKPMQTAPKDGTAVLVMLEGSDLAHAARWIDGPASPHVTMDNQAPGFWMAIPDDPEAQNYDSRSSRHRALREAARPEDSSPALRV